MSLSKGKRILIFETHPLLTSWLCYHARHNDVYFEGRHIGDSSVPQPDPFSKIPDLANVDFVATRDRLVDVKAPGISCLTLIDDTSAEDRRDGPARYGLGPPAALRFLAFRPISATLKMRLAPGGEAATLPVVYFLANDQGRISQHELWRENVDVRQMSFPRGLSTLQLSVKGKDSDPHPSQPLPILANLYEIEISDVDLPPGQ
jgi:hypothetical protein